MIFLLVASCKTPIARLGRSADVIGLPVHISLKNLIFACRGSYSILLQSEENGHSFLRSPLASSGQIEL